MRYFTLLLFIIFHFVWQSQAEAQCTWPSNAALYQTLTAPTTCIPTIESGCHYFYEYYRINSLVIGNSYTISVRNTTASSPPYEIGIFTSTTIGSTPIAFAQSPTFPMSITFTATTTTVYVIDFYTGCGNTGTNCNYYTVACNNCPTDALATNQPSTSAATQGSINNQVLRIDVPVCANSNITSVTCAEVGTALPSDISAARLYYTTSTTFATTNQFGSQLTIPADGVLTFTGSYNVPTSSKIYFWLVFDVACAATSGLTLDASLTNVIVDGSTRTAPTPNPTGTRSISTLTKSVSTTQNTTANVIPGSSNNDVLRLTVNNCVGTNVSTLNLSTGLSTAPSTDVSNAKVYVTTSTTFNTNILFGTASLPINGAFTVTGSYNLTATTVYFWIVYDISTSPTAGNVVDASCTNIVVDGNTLTPTTSNPAGTRTIVVPPSNDNCANATSLVCNAAAINGTTVNTVAEPSSPPGACSSLYGVWYTFVGDGSIVTITSVAASGYDHEIDLFSGSCGSLTNISCTDATSGTTETYNFTSTAGTTYYVYIAYFGSSGTSTQTGTFNISLTCAACAAPTSSAATGITSNTANANWTPTTGNFVIEYGPTATFTPVGTGATAGNPNNFVVTATNVGTIQLTSLSPSTGYSYVIRKDCAALGFSTNSTTQTFTTLGLPPSNDNCANATSLVCNAAAINGTTVNTVAEPSSPPGACSSLYGVWYTFVGDGSTVTISSTAASGFDHEIDLFSGSCGSLTNITCRDGSGSGGTETYNFTSTAGTTYYVYIAYYSSTGTSTQTGTFNISLTCVACAAPTSSAATGITSNSANANWTPTTGNFVIEYGPTATFTPVGTGATAGNPNNFIVTATNVGTIQLTSLSPSTGYSYVIRKDCAASGFSTNSTTQTFTTLITNDDASSAILLPLSSTCTNATLVGATANASEPSISCQGTNGNYTSVWFKFVAPSSGMVKISTDYAVPSVLTDSKLAVYSASNPADYSTFNIIGCDEDNGLTGSGYLSILYVAGLTGGNTYYVKVDKYSSITSAAPFCISVEELVASMLSTNTACPTVSTNTYVDAGTAWSSVIDATGNLIANVKLNGNNLDQIDGSQNINTAAVRQDALGRYYLDRNYLLKVSTQPTTPVGIQLFFKNTELSALTAVDPNATLSNLIVNKQPGTTCNSNFSASNGSVQVLTPTSGSGADLSYVQANVSSFSNFYISSQQSPLPVQLTAFNAVSKDGKTVELTWDVKNENNLSKYELEHSQNGVNFTVIGSVNAASLSKYKYIDENPFNGVNYYRLKIYDHDGKYSLSGVKQVVFQNGKSIVVYPNPTSGNVYFSGLENDGKTSQVSIYNEIGQLVWSNKLMNTELLEKGLEMADYSSGVYIIKIENNISNYTVRIVRQ